MVERKKKALKYGRAVFRQKHRKMGQRTVDISNNIRVRSEGYILGYYWPREVLDGFVSTVYISYAEYQEQSVEVLERRFEFNAKDINDVKKKVSRPEDDLFVRGMTARKIALQVTRLKE